MTFGSNLQLDELRALQPGLMYVFVAGPGRGEALAVALPDNGWLLLDGCRASLGSGADLPLGHILARWRRTAEDRVIGMVLSHPHADHVAGFADLLDSEKPKYVILANDPQPATEERQSRTKERNADSWAEKAPAASVRLAFEAIRSWQSLNMGEVLRVIDGDEIPLARPDVRASVRAPDDSALDAAFSGGFASARANEASLVIELRYGSAMFLLGGDLPHVVNGEMVPACWQRVMEQHNHLGGHHGLKVPHHGSKDALHPDLIAPAEQRRFWCLTPFNSKRLPDNEPRGGMRVLLEAEPSVHLTALSAKLALQKPWPPPARISIEELKDRTDANRTGNKFIDEATDLRPAFESEQLEPLDFVWCCAVDDSGSIVGRWRGRAAMEVRRA